MLGKVFRTLVGRGESRKPQRTASEWVDEGNVFAARGDHATALANYDEALLVDPGLAVAHNNRSLSLEAVGQLGEAWKEAEWRLEVQEGVRAFMRAVPIRRWRGELLAAGGLVVLWEQGFGDMLQYLRFLPLARARTSRLVFLCPPELERLVAASFPDVEVRAAGAPVTWTEFKAYVPLLSLPHVLGQDASRLPGQPYLSVPRAPTGRRDGELRVGIVWRSSTFDPGRDCSLEDLLEIKSAAASVVSLQFGATDAERRLLAAHGVPERVGADFFETAQAMLELDALVSVDTSPAHLAAALGKPVLLLLNEPAAVRWGIAREDTPWYPSMRLFRRKPADPWRAVLAQVAQALPATGRAAV